MKKIILFILCVLIFFSFPFCAYSYSARSMVVIEKTSKLIVDAVDCNKRMPMASTTKIMTALVVIEHIDINTIVSIPESACGIEGSSLYLRSGERLTVLELLNGLLLESGNDAAVALAIIVGGSVESFVSLMNAKADQLGLCNTHFENPSGLPDDNHYTTAYELSVIAAAALDNPVFSKIVSLKTTHITGRTLVNHNKLLSMYKYAIGVKTGFTKKAGRCLVSAAKKDDITLICVTLNASDDWNDHITAYENAFSKLSYQCIAKKGEVCVNLMTPDGKNAIARNMNDVYAVLFNGSEISKVVHAERIIYAPKAIGQSVGKVLFYANGNVVASTPIRLIQPIEYHISPKKEKSFFIFLIFNYIKGLFK